MRPLSWTSLTSWETCPLKWRFEYVDRLPTEPRWYHVYGQSVHAGLEAMGRHDGDTPPPLDEVMAAFEKAWDRRAFDHPAQERNAYEKASRLLRAFYVRHAPAWRRPAAVEHAFLTRIDGVPVRGYIDRLDRLPDGGLDVVDYKSGGRPWTPERVADHGQLALYQLAIENEWGETVERLSIYHLPSQAHVSAPRHEPPRLTDLRERLVTAADGIGSKAFTPNPGDHCTSCDFQEACPAWPFEPGAKPRGQTNLLRF